MNLFQYTVFFAWVNQSYLDLPMPFMQMIKKEAFGQRILTFDFYCFHIAYSEKNEILFLFFFSSFLFCIGFLYIIFFFFFFGFLAVLLPLVFCFCFWQCVTWNERAADAIGLTGLFWPQRTDFLTRSAGGWTHAYVRGSKNVTQARSSDRFICIATASVCLLFDAVNGLLHADP